ncbi:MAG: hypothetical protein IJC51_00575, partial [Eggerthellaceae bacterium]|nr:hypothetical protein [Eggerthellaceae bacterium]
MPIIHPSNISINSLASGSAIFLDPRLSVFSSMTDSELKDPKQMIGLSLALEASGQRGCRDELAQGLFIAESKNVIERALGNGCTCFALLVEERWLSQSQSLIDAILNADPNVAVFVVSAEQRLAITGYQMTRGPLAAFVRPKPRSLAELLRDARRVAILEDVTNFTNIGAIFRSAAALGIDAVLVSPSCHDPLYRRASRVSMGTVFQVPWTYIGSQRDWAAEGIPLL